jgi:hypothetical protein
VWFFVCAHIERHSEGRTFSSLWISSFGWRLVVPQLVRTEPGHETADTFLLLLESSQSRFVSAVFQNRFCFLEEKKKNEFFLSGASAARYRVNTFGT